MGLSLTHFEFSPNSGHTSVRIADQASSNLGMPKLRQKLVARYHNDESSELGRIGFYGSCWYTRT
jgi:hypothetical protein